MTEPDPLPPGAYVIVFRASDWLLADALGTDVPIIAHGRIPDPDPEG